MCVGVCVLLCICVANTSPLRNAYNRRNQLDSSEVHASEQLKGLFS